MSQQPDPRKVAAREQIMSSTVRELLYHLIRFDPKLAAMLEGIISLETNTRAAQKKEVKDGS